MLGSTHGSLWYVLTCSVFPAVQGGGTPTVRRGDGGWTANTVILTGWEAGTGPKSRTSQAKPVGSRFGFSGQTQPCSFFLGDSSIYPWKCNFYLAFGCPSPSSVPLFWKLPSTYARFNGAHLIAAPGSLLSSPLPASGVLSPITASLEGFCLLVCLFTDMWWGFTYGMRAAKL